MTELSPEIERQQDVDRLTSRYRLPEPLETAMRETEQDIADDLGGGIMIFTLLRKAILADQQALRTLLDDAHTLLIYAGASTQQRMDMAHRIARYLRADNLAPRSADEGEGGR